MTNRPSGARRRAPPAASPVAFRILMLGGLALAGFLVFVGPGTAMLLFAGLLPTIVAAVIDRSPDRLAAITVGPLNFAGVLVPLMQLWRGQGDLTHAIHLLTNPVNGAIVYGAAAGGWVLYHSLPQMVARATLAWRLRRLRRLVVDQRRLVEVWGEDVKGVAVKPPPG